MGLQRVRNNWATELNKYILICPHSNSISLLYDKNKWITDTHNRDKSHNNYAEWKTVPPPKRSCMISFIFKTLKKLMCSHRKQISKLLGEKAMATHSSTLAWEIPWMEEPMGYSPWGFEELDTTERLHFHFSLSCTWGGNDSPLHCSCLENPRDRGPWWAAVSGVAQSRTRLKRLSSSKLLGERMGPGEGKNLQSSMKKHMVIMDRFCILTVVIV